MDVVATFGIFFGEVDLSVVVQLHLNIATDDVHVDYDLFALGASDQISVHLFGTHNVRQRLTFF
jgi:hypothetical protein